MSIFSYVREARNNYEQDKTTVVEGYDYNQYDTINKATKYWASEYDGSDDDAILGKLPFSNIIIGNVEKETEATDFDTKDVEIRPKRNTNASRWKSRIATKGLQEHMERTKFAKTLNRICHTRSLYGGVMVKDTPDGTKVVPWQNLITDQSDIMGGVIIERHFYTPAELKKMDGKWDNIDEAITRAQEMKYADIENNDPVYTLGHFIEVFEIHGMLPTYLMEEDAEKLEFEQRMVVIAGADWLQENEDGTMEDRGLILYNETEKETPYKYNARNPIAGRGLGVGVAESLFENQTWHNFTLAEQYRALSIAGKVFFDSDNPEIPDNLLTQLDHGTVLKRAAEQSPLTAINTLPSGLPMYDRLRAEIAQSTQQITGAYDAVTGESNVNKPLGVVAIENIEGHSRYEQEREEIGEFIEEIIRDWELPRAMKMLREEDEIYASFEPKELLEIDQILIDKELNEKMLDRIMSGEPVTPEFIQEETDKIKKDLSRNGTKRLVKNVKDMTKDIEGDVRISTTSENKDRQAWFQNRVAVLQYIPPQDPRYNAIVDSMMDEMGITMEDVQVAMDKAPQQPQATPPKAPSDAKVAPQEEPAAALQAKQ